MKPNKTSSTILLACLWAFWAFPFSVLSATVAIVGVSTVTQGSLPAWIFDPEVIVSAMLGLMLFQPVFWVVIAVWLLVSHWFPMVECTWLLVIPFVASLVLVLGMLTTLLVYPESRIMISLPSFLILGVGLAGSRVSSLELQPGAFCRGQS